MAWESAPSRYMLNGEFEVGEGGGGGGRGLYMKGLGIKGDFSELAFQLSNMTYMYCNWSIHKVKNSIN